MVRGFNLKLVSICLMMLFIFQIAFPTISFALTGGPSSPGTTAFTPVGASELVDLNTGDFSYNIPLMTVPGPNGGYPINVGYKGGVSMEQEASWVGLGWDLSVGSITRNLRGLPDDFNGNKNSDQSKGDQVTQTLTYKPTVISSFTFPIHGLGINFKTTLFGKKLSISGGASSFTAGYNNYTGLSGGVGGSFSVGKVEIGANFDSKDGISMSPSYNFGKTRRGVKKPFKLSAGFSTSSGFSAINFSQTYQKKSMKGEGTRSSISAGVSFAKPSPIGDISSAQDIVTTHLGFGYGNYITPKYTEKLNFRLANTTISLKAKTKEVEAYGYMHLEEADEEDLMDFHKENELGVYDESPVLPMPVLDNDVYSISGQGISGSFRAYRSDIPLLQPHKVKSDKITIGATGEYGTYPGAGGHFGGDVVLGGGASTTSKWQATNPSYFNGKFNQHANGKIDRLEKQIGTRESTTDHPLYQPFYFDYMGKQTMADDDYYDQIGKNSAVLYNVAMSGMNNFSKGMLHQSGQLSSSAFNKGIKTDLNRDRNINTNHIGYYTKKELTNSKEYHASKSISQGNDDHIHEIAVSNTSGTKYVYGIPVYNLAKEDAMFSVDAKSNPIHASRIDYNGNSSSKFHESSVKNKSGKEHFYKSTKVGAYAHSYLLTSTLSDDYVDLTQNGPTNDDFGYWCKFEYDKATNYQWRAPFYGANYVEGNHSNEKDDKASFTHGTKEQYYLNKIETKTHAAVFTTDYRRDNCGSAGRDQMSAQVGARSKKLYSIKLYKKNKVGLFDPATSFLIKEVKFYYDYSQCKGVENYSTLSGDNHIIPNSVGNGKLTLRKIVILNQDNNKGEQAPYEFEYGNGAAQGQKGNNDYTYITNTDRWGTYQDIPSGFSNTSKYFPYTNQYMDVATRNQYASNWNLTEIKLPSKGKIKVEYESDDYSKIQDKAANQMFEIVGFGLTATPNLSKTKELREFNEIDDGALKPKTFVLFKKTDGTDFKDHTEVRQCIKGLDEIYFKSYVETKDDKPDFISGYLKVHDSYFPYRNNDDHSIGVFQIKNEEYSRLNNPIHPIQKIACQQFHSRTDLQSGFSNPLKQLRILIDGPVSQYKSDGIGRIMSAAKKSILRLNLDNKEVDSDYLPKVPGKTYGHDTKKYGGGIRVKSVKVETGWGETYGQKYSYVKEDGTTSGVADYEPGIGTEENSLKKPVVYNGVLDYNSSYGNDEFFTEGPFSEAFYPSPIVRYSRVITENIEPKDIAGTTPSIVGFKASNLGGITVNGYYTAEDFPVKERYTPISKAKTNKWDRYALPIPFGLDKPSRVSKVFSQGYVVELNDMAGKPKYVATFHYADKANKNLNLASAKTKVEYRYHTDKNDSKKLDSKVLVLTQDRIFSKQTIGRKEEFYAYQHENFDYNRVHTVSGSIGLSIKIPSIVPTPDYIYGQYARNRSLKQRRLLVTNKVIYHTGVLKEVETNDNGRITVSKNLAYDAYTGEALVQTQENDWDKPVYSYNYAGNWKYPELGGKYQNYRAKFKVGGSAGVYTLLGTNKTVSEVLQVGDLIKVPQGSGKDENVYVTGVTSNTFDAKKLDNNDLPLNGKVVTIMESGFRNLQSVKLGNYVSLDNPILFPAPGQFIKNAFSKLVNVSNPEMINAENYDTINCDTIQYNFDSHSSETNAGITTYKINVSVKNDTTESCLLYLSLGTTVPFHSTNITYEANSLKIKENNQYSFTYNLGGVRYTGTISADCDLGCPINVLHASATELSDQWTYNYEDLGYPSVSTDYNASGHSLLTASVGNDYAFGRRGKWKAYRSWVNQVDRQQKGNRGDKSEIDRDGEYNTFKYFQWNVDTTRNQKNNWDWTNLMTKYSPYGYDLENKNPLHIYSSELYGYDNSLVTAVGANAAYNEIAFDNIEVNKGTTSNYEFSGHFNSISGQNIGTTGNAHTGKKAISIDGTKKFETKSLTFKEGREYIFSFWVLTEGANDFTFNIFDKQLLSTPLKTYNYNFDNLPTVEGFTKIDIPFTNTTSDMNDIIIEVKTGGNGSCIMDDLRIHPSSSAFKSYVYDSNTLKLIAELDNLNFATYYHYDEEGKLIRVLKATKEGIFTIKESRDNIAH